MANKGIYSYTVQEGTNAGLGQGGSMFIKGGTTYGPLINGQVFLSITILTPNTTFTKLEAVDNKLYIGTEGTSSVKTPPGTDITTETFPQGITIYGRWTTIKLGSGMDAVAYLGS
tara:strand:- start:658 stop:1002 length:345 start_codon:yes stop_codon:yes gene_type:complete